jgi:3-oxoacyl-[acyl-carrier-protein] synthase II
MKATISNNRVVITGLGAITPIGNTVDEFWKGLLEGRSGAAPFTRFDASAYPTRFACEVKGFIGEDHFDRKEVKKLEHFVQYAIVASRQALADSGLDLAGEDLNRIGVYIGSGIGGLATIEEQHSVLLEKGMKRVSPFLIPKLIANLASGQVSIMLGVKGPNLCIVTACATGTHSIGEAFKVIQRGQAVAMFAGGAEAALTPLGVAGFCNMRAISERNDEPEKASRPFDLNRDGFVMGEGAGILLLEDYEHAKARGARIYAEITGYGLTGDAFHITAPSPDGDGAARAMQMALDDAGLPPTAVNHINAHGTSTPLNDKLETLAIKRVLGEHARNVPVTANKSMIGHLLGAAGGAEAVAACLTITHGIIPPTINYETPDPECDLDYVPNQPRRAEVTCVLSNSLGFGGHNTTIALQKCE